MKAFSEKNDNLQLVWDASSLKNLQFCPRYYQISNLQGWQGDSVDLSFGRYVASGFERYQKARLDGKSREDALVEVVRWALMETYFEAKSCSLGVGCDEAGVCYAAAHGEAHQCGRSDSQWGGSYETMWKCKGTEKYKNEKGNKAICPFAFKQAWFPGEAPEACPSCRSGIHVERRYVPDDTAKNRITLIRALIWYGLEQPEDLDEGYRPYVFPDGTAAVELSGRMPLPWKAATGEQFMIAWNFDYIGSAGSENFITDNKTTRKTLNGQFFETYAVDTQFDTYDLVGSIAYPDLNIRGVMVDAVQLMVEGVAFGRQPYYKTESQREEHLADLQYWMRQAESYAEANYWPMAKRSCWLCPFKRVCSLPPEQRDGYLKSNFHRGERWDTMRER